MSDAGKFLERLLGDCDGDTSEHAWRKCRRCLAFSELENHQPLARRLVTRAIELLKARIDLPYLLERVKELEKENQELRTRVAPFVACVDGQDLPQIGVGGVVTTEIGEQMKDEQITTRQRRKVLERALDLLSNICVCGHLDTEHVFRSIESRSVRRCHPRCSCRQYRRVSFSLMPSAGTLHLTGVMKLWKKR